MLPHSLAIGIPYTLFWHLTPKKIKAFEKAYEIRRKIDDEKAYMQGIYTLKAISVVAENVMAGLCKRKAQAEYFKEPLLTANQPPTEEELQKQREEFVAMLETMRANFELKHKKSGDKNEL